MGGAEPQYPGAQSADGPGRRLQNPHALAVHPHFRVDWAVREAQGGHCGLRGFADLPLDVIRLARKA